MTYSCKIDPNKAICPNALAGSQCPDGKACAYQHFENMVVPGESPRETETPFLFAPAMQPPLG